MTHGLLLKKDEPIYQGQVSGRCPSKKNTKKVVRRYGRTMVIYSAQFREWETRALVELRQTWNGKTIDQPLEAVFRFYFKNRQAESDLSNVIEAPQDALTKAGVIIDDKIIQVIHATKIFGHEPRVEIELRHI